MGEGGIRAGPIGRILRLMTGLALVFEGGRHLIGTNSSLVGMTVGVEPPLEAI